MMKCKNCNSEIEDDSVFCEYCGTKVSKDSRVEKKDTKFWVLAVTSFWIPIVGFILFSVKHKEYPSQAKTYLWCAIAGFVVGILLNVFLSIFVLSNV